MTLHSSWMFNTSHETSAATVGRLRRRHHHDIVLITWKGDVFSFLVPLWCSVFIPGLSVCVPLLQQLCYITPFFLFFFSPSFDVPLAVSWQHPNVCWWTHCFLSFLLLLLLLFGFLTPSSPSLFPFHPCPLPPSISPPSRSAPYSLAIRDWFSPLSLCFHWSAFISPGQFPHISTQGQGRRADTHCLPWPMDPVR